MPWSNQNGGGGGGWKGGGGGPWGQGPSGGGSPDLEDILKRSQDRLKKAMPGGSGMSGGFIALLVLQIADRVQIAVALVTGALSVGLLLAGLEQWSVMIATVIGAAIGVILEKWNKRPSS